jgi:hypothetical protein
MNTTLANRAAQVSQKRKRGKTRGNQSGWALARMISGRYGMAVAPGTASRWPR